MRIIIIFLSLLALFSCNKEGSYVVQGVVKSYGSCGGGEGYFSGNYECAIEVKTKYGIQYWNLLDKAIVGQTVYRKCWPDDGKIYCSGFSYTSIQPSWDELEVKSI